MKKSLFSRLFVLFLAITVIVSATSHYAHAASITQGIISKEIDEDWDFEVIQSENQNSVSRFCIDKNRKNDSTDYDYNRTKALLVKIGMREEIVKNLPESELKTYSECDVFYKITSYYKESPDGLVQISKNEHSSRDSDGYAHYNNGSLEIDFILSGIQTRPHWFVFVVESEWKNMPLIRLTDTLGATASHIAIDPATRYGSYSYKETTVNWGKITERTIYGQIPAKDMVDATNQSWMGSAIRFKLPEDIEASSDMPFYLRSCSKYIAHYKFEGVVTHPSLATNFNSVATYAHGILMPTLSPEIGFSGTGANLSIGLLPQYWQERFNTDTLLIQYVPRK